MNREDANLYRCFRCGLAQANGWVLQSETVTNVDIVGKGSSPEKRTYVLLVHRPYCRDCNTENKVGVNPNANL